jgi:8-oxo-dGTP pyrophosphatase MutT (NUDIX family)
MARRGILSPVLDALYRIALRAAYLLMRMYWSVVRPATHGVLVAVWHGGEVLIVRTSYQRLLSMPGGYQKRGEDPVAAARRELREEVGLEVAAEDLRLAFTMRHDWLGKDEHVTVLEHRPARRPQPTIDRREIVEARFLTPAEALRLELLPPVRRALEGAEAGRG